MLAVKRLAILTSEVNLRNPLHTGDEVCNQGIHLGFEIQGRLHQKSKNRGTIGNTKRTYVLQKFFEKITGRILQLCNIRRKNKYGLSSFSKWRGILFSRHLTPMGKLVYSISIFGAMFQNLHVLIPPPPQNKLNLSWITLSKCLIPLVRTF